MTTLRSVLATTVALLAAAALTACSTGSPTASPASASSAPASSASTSPAPGAATPSASASNPYGTVTVDPPGANDPVLTITGGSGGTVALTLAQLEALGTQTVTLDEPFIKARQTFTGVPLAAVLAKAGIPSGARIDTKALNDFEYANLASAFTGSNALIATRRGSEPVPFDAGGPIRIVFPDGTPLSSVLDSWNWSLASITVAASG